VRIAYFTDSLPPITDGVARTLANLVDTLLADRVEFRFFSAIQPPADLPWADRVYTVGSVPFPPYPLYRVALPWSFTLDQIVDRFRPDLVHVVSPTTLGMYGLSYARRRGLPVVGSFHTHFVSYFRFYGVGAMEGLGWRYLTWFYNQCAVTFAPSPTTARELEVHGIAPVDLWERGIDCDRFSPEHRSAAVRAGAGAMDRPLLLYVGRLVREKNLAVLADATALLRQRSTPFALALVGDGPMRAELERRLPDAVFAGTQSGEALARWYASADLFVFPSTTETFGNVILEAFASALPVVGADSGGVHDLVSDGVNGLLAAPNSAEDLARCLERLLTDRLLMRLLGERARRVALSYRWPDVNRRLLGGYRDVLFKHRAIARTA
jgi:glycosyltransferase involved in cell wall biosynthesis